MAARLHDRGDVAEQRSAAVVTPVVNDVLHGVAVTGLWHGLEEVAADAPDLVPLKPVQIQR